MQSQEPERRAARSAQRVFRYPGASVAHRHPRKPEREASRDESRRFRDRAGCCGETTTAERQEALPCPERNREKARNVMSFFS